MTSRQHIALATVALVALLVVATHAPRESFRSARSLADAVKGAGNRMKNLISVSSSSVTELAQKAGISAGKLSDEAALNAARSSPAGQKMGSLLDKPDVYSNPTTFKNELDALSKDKAFVTEVQSKGIPPSITQKIMEGIGDNAANIKAWDNFTKNLGLRWTGMPRKPWSERLKNVAAWTLYIGVAIGAAILANELASIIDEMDDPPSPAQTPSPTPAGTASAGASDWASGEGALVSFGCLICVAIVGLACSALLLLGMSSDQ